MTSLRRVLVVDDEFLIADLLCMMVEDLGMVVCGTADTASEAVSIALQEAPDLVLMDMRLKGDGDGVGAALAIKAELGCPILFITGSAEPESIDRIMAISPAGLLIKPITPYQFKTAVEGAFGEGEAVYPAGRFARARV